MRHWWPQRAHFTDRPPSGMGLFILYRVEQAGHSMMVDTSLTSIAVREACDSQAPSCPGFAEIH
jgi:hypothetical protein